MGLRLPVDDVLSIIFMEGGDVEVSLLARREVTELDLRARGELHCPGLFAPALTPIEARI